MIRINLLPFRAVRKKETIQKQIIIYFVSIGLVFAPLFWFHNNLKKEILTYSNKIADTEKELQKQEKKAKLVEEYTKKLDDLKRKMDVVKTLEKGRREAFDMLLDVSDEIIPKKMWFNTITAKENLKQEGKNKKVVLEVSLEGIAFDDKTVATYMENLQKLNRFDNVSLIVSETSKITKNLFLKKFQLKCDQKPVIMEDPEAAKKAAAAPKKKKKAEGEEEGEGKGKKK